MGPAALVLPLALLGDPLNVESPLHCPSEDQVAAAIAHYLGRAIDLADPSTDMRIDEVRGGYRLELHTQAGTHVIEGGDCGRLVDLAASVAAIAIDPLAGMVAASPPSFALALARREPEPVEGIATEPTRVPPLAQPPPPVAQPLPQPAPALPASAPSWQLVEIADPPERPGDASLRGLLSASASLGLGLFPNPAPGFEAALGLDRRAFHLELGGAGSFAGRFRAADAEVGGDLRAFQATLRPCGAPRWRRVELRACGLVGAGLVRAVGVGVRDPAIVRQPWVSLGAELGLALVLHRNAALFVDAGAAANLVRPHVWTEAPNADYQMPLVSGRGRLGVEVRFP